MVSSHSDKDLWIQSNIQQIAWKYKVYTILHCHSGREIGVVWKSIIILSFLMIAKLEIMSIFCLLTYLAFFSFILIKISIYMGGKVSNKGHALSMKTVEFELRNFWNFFIEYIVQCLNSVSTVRIYTKLGNTL